MVYATILAALYMTAIAVLTFVLSNPFIFVVGLLMFSNFMQNIPFGLNQEEDDDQGKPAGFHADID